MNVDNLQIQLNQGQQTILYIILAFLMFSVALDMRRADFERVWQQPRPVWVGLLLMWLLMPLWCILLTWLWQPPLSIALGVVLVAACPGGAVSNFATHWASGTTALAVTTTTITTLAAAVTLPLIFWGGAQLLAGQAMQTQISLNFAELVKMVVTLILFPLLLGMALSYWFPIFTNKLKKILKPLSLIVFVLFIVGALLGNFNNLKNYLHHIFGFNLVLNASAMLLGYAVAKLARLSEAEARALTFETSLHNTALGLILALTFFKGLGGMMLIVAWYGIWDLVTAFLLAWFWSRRLPQ